MLLQGLGEGAAAAARNFEVLVVGEARWELGPGGALRPAGGALRVARALALTEVRVGLVSAVEVDTSGRRALEGLAAAGVDVGGVQRVLPKLEALAFEGSAASQGIVPLAHGEEGVEVPAGWSAKLLLLVGLTPSLPYAASLCKAARKARREGSLVVLDVDAGWRAWQGYDGRTAHMILREVDVLRASTADFMALGLDPVGVRALLPEGATVVLTELDGAARARGPFGETLRAAPQGLDARAPGAGDAFTAGLCAELARGTASEERWERALRGAHRAASTLTRALRG